MGLTDVVTSPIGAVLDLGGKLIDRLWPDPATRDKAKLELLKLQQEGELQTIAGQLEINKLEAQSPSLFVSGWRPAVGWICAAGLGYQFLLRPLLTGVSALFGWPTGYPELDMGTLLTLLGGMLGLSVGRTVEKLSDKAAR